MKKRRNKTQKTKLLLYAMLIVIFGIMILINKLTIPCIIVGILITELISYKYKTWRNKRYLKANLKVIDTMEGEEFEEFLEIHFKKNGYKVKLTPKVADYGADLILKKNGVKTVVQAKRWKQKVGIEAVQQAVGSINYYKASNAMVVTNSRFTENAINLAKANNVKLIDRNKLIEIINHKEDKQILCPTCSSELIIREGKHGKFYGCSNFPKCKYTQSV